MINPKPPCYDLRAWLITKRNLVSVSEIAKAINYGLSRREHLPLLEATDASALKQCCGTRGARHR